MKDSFKKDLNSLELNDECITNFEFLVNEI